MKHITTWRPDTCGCTIHYEWDDSLSDADRVHIPVEEVTTHDGLLIKRYCCPVHNTDNGVGKHHDHFTKVQEENNRKNKVLNELMNDNPEFHVVAIDEETGEEYKKWKPGMKPTWSFDEDRNLVITTKSSLSSQIKKTIKDKLEAKYQKVIIN